jgi:hypothetical protein
MNRPIKNPHKYAYKFDWKEYFIVGILTFSILLISVSILLIALYLLKAL